MPPSWSRVSEDMPEPLGGAGVEERPESVRSHIACLIPHLSVLSGCHPGPGAHRPCPPTPQLRY